MCVFWWLGPKSRSSLPTPHHISPLTLVISLNYGFSSGQGEAGRAHPYIHGDIKVPGRMKNLEEMWKTHTQTSLPPPPPATNTNNMAAYTLLSPTAATGVGVTPSSHTLLPYVASSQVLFISPDDS